MTDPVLNSTTSTNRRWLIFSVWGLAAIAIGILAAKANYSPDLRGMLPGNDPVFVREMDFYARQGATRVLALEADGELSATRRVLTNAVAALKAIGVKPLDGGGAGAVARAAEIIRDHLPAFTTPEILRDIETNLGREQLNAYMVAFKERALRPEDAFTASAARRDLLAISGRVMQPLLEGLAGSERDGMFMRHSDGRHLMVVLEVPFDPQAMLQTAPMMEVIDKEVSAAKASGVALEAIGPYRHFNDNMKAVYSDLGITAIKVIFYDLCNIFSDERSIDLRNIFSLLFSPMPLAILLIGALLFSLVPNFIALIVLHLPAVLGMAGGVATVVLLGLDVPLPLLGFAAGMLGVAVDYGQHVLVAIRSGEGATVWRPLLVTYLTTASAFAVLVTSAVPGIRCVGIMVISGLGVALLASITLLPHLSPKLKPKDYWLHISTPLLTLLQRRPMINWMIAGVITAALVPGLWRLSFNDNLKSYDGSKRETWAALESFLGRWGSLSSSDFLVGQDHDLGLALDHIATARERGGFMPSMIERLMPGPATQAARIAGWNDFWQRHADSFATDLEASAKANGLRIQAFAESLALYRPMAGVEPITLASWTGSAVEPLVRSYFVHLDDGRWQVSSPVEKLTRAEVDRVHQVLNDRSIDAPVWLASREHIGHTLIAVVSNDLASRSIAIVLVVLLVIFLIERQLRAVIAQLLPPGIALLWTFGLLGWMGVQLDPFAVLAAAFIGGIGIDSAVFLTHSPNARTLSPVLVASLTTIVGMLSLLSAQHPTIFTMGRTLLIGMSCCLVACLLITPALADRDKAITPEPT